MANEATPLPAHDIPSLPASPDPKRTKYTEPAANLTVASILNDAPATPTPDAAPIVTNMSIHPHPAMPPMSMSPPPPPLQVQLLTPTARAPTRGSPFSAGYDLYASRSATVPAWGKVLVETDISIALPANSYGRVAPRSGLASKHSIHTGAGVIDADYRGPVKVLLFNLSESAFEVAEGDRVAQLIIERIWTPDVMVVDKLEETVRGAGGFGSTGGFGGVLPGINGMTGQ